MYHWQDFDWPAQTKVHVLECLGKNKTNYLGKGKLVQDFNPKEESFENSPTIIMSNGRKIRGFDCWWIPVEVIDGKQYLGTEKKRKKLQEKV